MFVHHSVRQPKLKLCAIQVTLEKSFVQLVHRGQPSFIIYHYHPHPLIYYNMSYSILAGVGRGVMANCGPCGLVCLNLLLQLFEYGGCDIGVQLIVHLFIIP